MCRPRDRSYHRLPRCALFPADGALPSVARLRPCTAPELTVELSLTALTLYNHRPPHALCRSTETYSQPPLELVRYAGCSTLNAGAHSTITSRVSAKGASSKAHGAPESDDRTHALSLRPSHAHLSARPRTRRATTPVCGRYERPQLAGVDNSLAACCCSCGAGQLAACSPWEWSVHAPSCAGCRVCALAPHGARR